MHFWLEQTNATQISCIIEYTVLLLYDRLWLHLKKVSIRQKCGVLKVSRWLVFKRLYAVIKRVVVSLLKTKEIYTNFPPHFSVFSTIFSVFCAIFSVFQAIFFGFPRNIFGFFGFWDFFGFSVFSAEKKYFFRFSTEKKNPKKWKL